MTPAPADAPARDLVLLALLVAQRMGELWLSRRHIERVRSSADSAGAPRTAGTRADWWSMIAIHAALVLFPAGEVLWLGARASDAQFGLGLAAYAAAQVLRYWSIASLGECWNARAVVDPRRACVATGPYRWIRHPNYLAVIVEFSAVPLALGAWRSWIVLNLLHAPILARRIRAEERLLAEIPGYAQHMQTKGRFVPRVRAPSSRRA
jgi:methyltransferase